MILQVVSECVYKRVFVCVRVYTEKYLAKVAEAEDAGRPIKERTWWGLPHRCPVPRCGTVLSGLEIDLFQIRREGGALAGPKFLLNC
jgi:hypothetical protein